MRRRPDRTLSVIASLGADLVVLQEADRRMAPRPAALPHDMAEADGWHILPFGAPGGSLGWHGNAMLAGPGIRLRHTLHLDLPGLEPRGAILAELDSAIGPLRVIGVHLGLVRRYRQLQLATILRHLARAAPMPTVLAGDFNEWRRFGWLEQTVDDLHFLPTPPSFPALRPVARLDRIAHCGQLCATDCGHHAETPAHVASDHLPVWADFTKS